MFTSLDGPIMTRTGYPSSGFVRRSKSLPCELKALFACSHVLPQSPRWKVFDIELRSGKCETIEFNEAVGCFRLLYPAFHAELSSHLKFISDNRNVAVHSFFPHFHKYEVDRTIYVALRVLQIDLELQRHEFLSVAYPELETTQVARLIAAFESERVERVRKAQEDAKKQAKKLANPITIELSDLEWHEYTAKCSICHSDALLIGSTEIDGTGPDDVRLAFKAHSFRCEGCGLELRDPVEMRLAGEDTDYDRSDQMDEWVQMHADDDAWLG